MFPDFIGTYIGVTTPCYTSRSGMGIYTSHDLTHIDTQDVYDMCI